MARREAMGPLNVDNQASYEQKCRREGDARFLGGFQRNERPDRGFYGQPYRKRVHDEGPGEPNIQVIFQGLEPNMIEIDVIWAFFRLIFA